MQTIDTKTDNELDDPVDDKRSPGNTEAESLPNLFDNLDLDLTTKDESVSTQADQSSLINRTEQDGQAAYQTRQSTPRSEPAAETTTNAPTNSKKRNPKKYDKKLNRWPRAFARLLDLTWEMSIIMAVMAYFISSASISIGFGSPVLYLMLFISLPIALMLDAVIASLLGNTPFKALIGVKAVTARGERLGLGKHIRRNYGVWTDGLGMGILPMSLYTLVRQFKRVSGRREAIYDERLHARSHSSNYAGLRLTSLVLVGIGAVAGLFIYANLKHGDSTDKATNLQTESIVEQTITTEPESADSNESSAAASATAGNESQLTQTSSGDVRLWVNPVSNLQSEIPQRFSSTSSTDALAVFRDLSSGTEIVLEKIDHDTLGDDKQATSELIKSRFNHIEFYDQVFSFPLGKWLIYEMQGFDSTEQSRVKTQISKVTGSSDEAYLVLSTTTSPDQEIHDDIDRLKSAIWSTLPTP